MYLTVEQAMSVYPLSEGKLVAGTEGRGRIVKSVNVMDAPDITDWIKEGEMLFTTAFLIKDAPEDAAQLLHKLNRRGSSGLGIKLGRFWDVIPQPMVALANDLGFPLIELPYQFTFSDQMNGLFRAEMQRNTHALHTVVEKQKKLMRFALQSDHNRQLFDDMSGVIGYPIAIVGSKGQMVYNASGIADSLLLQGWPWLNRNQWMRIGQAQAFRVPFVKHQVNTGFALFFTSESIHMTIEEGLFYQAAELISFHMNFRYEDYFERSLHKDFGMLIKRYLNHGIAADVLADFAKKLDLELFEGEFLCALADFSCNGDMSSRQLLLERLKDEYLSHPAVQEMNGIHVVMEEGVLSIYPNGREERTARLTELLHACFNSMDIKGGELPKAAVGGRKSSLADLKGAFAEVKETLRMALELGIGEAVVFCHSLELAYIFEQVSPERMELYCNKILGKLLAKDSDSALEMLRTLEIYIESDGQVNEAAKRLFVHRNTAAYRIEKLSEMLEVDFKKINDLLRLKLALLFRQLLARDSAVSGSSGDSKKRLR
ncbi:purine catabolism regulatory protein [Paenibacillus abyssi]|uniref:Purine catabolism regulatory protein n=1 Tax=Paenibacillus abyssi TaxID=1340531 RepID=A0A917FSL1_9BACL|nr:purine catabolism regulatory protein [Paenibacillus abyssi]